MRSPWISSYFSNPSLQSTLTADLSCEVDPLPPAGDLSKVQPVFLRQNTGRPETGLGYDEDDRGDIHVEEMDQ